MTDTHRYLISPNPQNSLESHHDALYTHRIRFTIVRTAQLVSGTDLKPGLTP